MARRTVRKPWTGIAISGSDRDVDLRPKPRDVSLELPWPPSVNQIWRTVNGRPILSADARHYRLDVAAAVLEAGCRNHFGRNRLRVEIRACQSDRRRRDLDNLAKATLDALTASDLWEDDHQVDELFIRRSISLGTARIEVLVSVITE